MAIDTKDIYWLSGILEGEGCFSISTAGRGNPLISLRMTDLDIVNRARNLLCPYNQISTAYREGNRKAQYFFTCCGNEAIQWMMTLYPLMGERRRTKIKECIELWKSKIPFSGYCYRGHKIADSNAMRSGKSSRLQCRLCYSRRKYSKAKNV